jgi:hypothetical protein
VCPRSQLCVTSCCSQAISPACAVCPPKSRSRSVMAISQPQSVVGVVGMQTEACRSRPCPL